MRLINVWTLELHEFACPPPYAILSHRWTNQETNLQDFIDATRRRGPGFEKIRKFCAFLRLCPYLPRWRKWNEFCADWTLVDEPIHWAWVDTCCIDKTSSTDLNEAINSMWKWYSQAAFCVAFLSDVPDVVRWQEHFLDSEWFQRGWTLQELLAPRQVVFCNCEWQALGLKVNASSDRALFLEAISAASRIPVHYLQDPNAIRHASVAQRMSWASRRHTTKVEDTAYSLFGIFQVHLPLLYGEGERAFRRLQEEIVRQSDDDSIFAWTMHDIKDDGIGMDAGLLAAAPSCFSECSYIHCYPMTPRKPHRFTSMGLELYSPLKQVESDVFLLQLNCIQVDGVPTLSDAGLFTGRDVYRRSYRAHACSLPLTRGHDGTYRRSNISPRTVSSTALCRSKDLEPSLLYIRVDPAEPAFDQNRVCHQYLSNCLEFDDGPKQRCHAPVNDSDSDVDDDFDWDWDAGHVPEHQLSASRDSALFVQGMDTELDTDISEFVELAADFVMPAASCRETLAMTISERSGITLEL